LLPLAKAAGFDAGGCQYIDDGGGGGGGGAGAALATSAVLRTAAAAPEAFICLTKVRSPVYFTILQI
jgi:hypothetical protein